MVLVWGGIRGGVSIALVLSMPEGEYKNLLLEVTYIVVLFSIVVQGLTVGKLAKKVLEKGVKKEKRKEHRAKNKDFILKKKKPARIFLQAFFYRLSSFE